MKNILLFIWMVPILTLCGQKNAVSTSHIGGNCEDCKLMYEGMPSQLMNKYEIASPEEPGEKIKVNGIIYQSDGKTPASDIILYVYHTNAHGLYAQSPGQKHGKRHGYLRGWMKTGRDGYYEFTSILPASYPNSTIPSHIHPIIKEPGKNEYYLDDFLFDDDPLLTEAERNRQEGRGGFGILKLVRNPDGSWSGNRDIVLGKNIPGY